MFRLCVLLTCALAINGNSFEEKIVGGDIALIQDYPYTVSVQLFGLHFCGGSIISKREIITAAHCLHGLTTQGVKIRAGSSKFSHDGQLVSVIHIKEHEKFERLTHNYDISILTLDQDLEFNESVQPIKLAIEEPSSGVAVVTGWGHTSEGGQLSLRLRKVELPIISREHCEYILTDFVTETMLCAGVLPDGGKDSCQGDSGGPLVLNGELVGVVSFGFGCGRPYLPGLYTSIAKIFSGGDF